MTGDKGKTHLQHLNIPMNEYERKRLETIEANKTFMKTLGIKRIAASLTSLVDSTKAKSRKKKQKATNDDDDYVPDDNVLQDECEKEDQLVITRKAKTCAMKEGRKKGNFIPPNSMAKLLRMNRNRQTVVGNEIEIVQRDMNEELVRDYHTDVEMDKENPAHSIIQDNMATNYEPDGPIGRGAGLDDAFPNEVDGESSSKGESMNMDGEISIRGTVKKTRGPVYCRKLTSLPPGEKIRVDFNQNGIAIGPYASLYAFFLGEQVRNRSVCPVQVKGWDEFKPETLEHLWSCVLEKCSFDDPELRKNSVMEHARRLFRNSRHKLKAKYFDDPKLTTKEQRLKNKPPDMVRADWIYLVEHWSDPKFQAKSRKASESRSHQKMPHYSGTKSFGRIQHEIKEKNEGKCSRLDVMIESRKRKSKKSVNDITLAKNMDAVAKIKKLKEEREQGLNQKTDEQIFQDVLGKDTHGYLRAYGPGKSITEHFRVKPSRLDLAQEVVEVKKTAEQAVLEAKKEAEDARKEAEDAKKEAESARKEVEATRNEVDQKIAANNKLWEKRLKRILQVCEIDSSNSNDSESASSSS